MSTPAQAQQESLIIRSSRPDDRAALHRLVAEADVFSDEEVTCARELIDSGIEREQKGVDGDYYLLVAELPEDGRVAGYICYGRVPFTKSAWDLYWLATHPAVRRRGVARALCATMEAHIRDKGGTVVRLDTSGTDGYGAARVFYESVGYTLVAQLPDFYKPGDDLYMFLKQL